MCSSGMRVGGWQYLKWKHITPLYSDQNDKQVVVTAAKLIVYAEEPEEYYTFVTPEAYAAVKDWMDFREADGEKVTGESWVMRDLWATKNVKRAAKGGLASNPRRLRDAGIKKLLNRALSEQHIRQALPEGERRHEFKTSHGYRKFFKTRAEGVMKPLNVELLMDHNSGISESYYRPTEKEVLEDYLKAVDLLTLNKEQKATALLQKQVTVLTERNEQENYAIMGKLAEKEKEIEEIKTGQKIKEEEIAAADAALDKKLDAIQQSLTKRDKRIEDLSKLKDTNDQEIEDLRKTIRQTEEMREFVFYHLDDKTREEFTMRLQKITSEERKRLQEMKMWDKLRKDKKENIIIIRTT